MRGLWRLTILRPPGHAMRRRRWWPKSFGNCVVTSHTPEYPPFFGGLESEFRDARHKILGRWFTGRLNLVACRVSCILSLCFGFLSFATSLHLTIWAVAGVILLLWLAVQSLMGIWMAKFSVEGSFILSSLQRSRIPWKIVVGSFEESIVIAKRLASLWITTIVLSGGSCVYLYRNKGLLFSGVSAVVFMFIVLLPTGAVFFGSYCREASGRRR